MDKKRSQVEIFSSKEFVPQGHLLRKIDSVIKVTRVYDFVTDLYCKNNGRPSGPSLKSRQRNEENRIAKEANQKAVLGVSWWKGCRRWIF